MVTIVTHTPCVWTCSSAHLPHWPASLDTHLHRRCRDVQERTQPEASQAEGQTCITHPLAAAPRGLQWAYLGSIVWLVSNEWDGHNRLSMVGCLIQAVDSPLHQEYPHSRVAQNIILGCPLDDLDVGPELQRLQSCVTYVQAGSDDDGIPSQPRNNMP